MNWADTIDENDVDTKLDTNMVFTMLDAVALEKRVKISIL